MTTRRNAVSFVQVGVLLACCSSCVTSKRDDVANAGKAVVAEPDASTLGPAALRVEASAPEGGLVPPPSAPVTAFTAVVEGACASAFPYAIGTSSALVINRDAWVIGPEGPRILYRMGGASWDALSGTMHQDSIGLVGGIDEAHAWAQLRTSSGRGEDTSTLIFRSPEWHTLKTPRGSQGQYGITDVLTQPDGSLWAYAEHGMYLDIPGDSRNGNGDADHNRYFAWSSAGEPLTINLPGGDMRFALRLASGEIVAPGVSKTGEQQLRRWSPTKKVDDLVVKGSGGSSTRLPVMRVGTTRAVMFVSTQGAIFSTYAGDALTPSGLNARLGGGVGSWLVTSSDDLMAVTTDGRLLIERKDGAITEEKLPEPGRLAPEPSVPWLIAASGVLYRRDGATWVKVALPESPWAAETHPPARIEWVRTVAGETWVSTVRTDLGFGLRKPGEIHVFYSSKARPAPIRCGAPLGPEATLSVFPPRATASCETPVVVVASEKVGDKPASYPKLGAALKGNAALGDTLSFVGFGLERAPVLGIAAKTPAIAAELVKALAKVAPHAPEIVCGTVEERRRLDFDVKTGVFSARP